MDGPGTRGVRDAIVSMISSMAWGILEGVWLGSIHGMYVLEELLTCVAWKVKDGIPIGMVSDMAVAHQHYFFWLVGQR